MDAFDSGFILPLAVVTLLVAIASVVPLVRFVRARRKAKRRVVEQPNSHYSSHLVRETEAKHRWQNMALGRIHEINRAEVERLLAKVEAMGTDVLRDNERIFLDRMAELAGKEPPAEPRDKGKQITPDLQHRPA